VGEDSPHTAPEPHHGEGRGPGGCVTQGGAAEPGQERHAGKGPSSRERRGQGRGKKRRTRLTMGRAKAVQADDVEGRRGHLGEEKRERENVRLG
jgi:hypothetical protein